MTRSSIAALLAATLLSTSCLNVANNNVTLNFDLTQPGVGAGWTVGAADFPASRLADVALVGDLRATPVALTPGLYQSGTNVTGDLFVYQKKYACCINPGNTFQVSLNVVYATNYASGCTTGPGPAVAIKAGLSATEPDTVRDAQGVLRMNQDKGTATSPGQFAQLGDLTNGGSGCPAQGTFALRTSVTSRQISSITIDPQGGFWMFLGTQSSFAGRHEVYLLGLQVILQ